VKSNPSSFVIRSGTEVGGDCPLLVIAGPCVIESVDLCHEIAGLLCDVCRELSLNYVFKASFDKANRTSVSSFRGPGLDEGLSVLASVKDAFGVPVLTDVHEAAQVGSVSSVADVLQIPAFLCRQTDLLVAAGKTGKPINIKKGQFLAPDDMATAVEKVRSSGGTRILLTERGTTFGYHNLVVDMRSLLVMRGLGVPVIFDATHSVQLPGGHGSRSGGQREYVAPLARAAAAVGIDGVFLEVHPEPARARCDGPNSIPLDSVGELLSSLKEIHAISRSSVPSLDGGAG